MAKNLGVGEKVEQKLVLCCEDYGFLQQIIFEVLGINILTYERITLLRKKRGKYFVSSVFFVFYVPNRKEKAALNRAVLKTKGRFFLLLASILPESNNYSQVD